MMRESSHGEVAWLHCLYFVEIQNKVIVQKSLQVR
jgi:hypothetical protein